MKPPKQTKVESSNLDGIAHDKSGLWVWFKSGGLYRYPEAPKEVYDRFVKAESAGSFFRSEVMGKFRHDKINA